MLDLPRNCKACRRRNAQWSFPAVRTYSGRKDLRLPQHRGSDRLTPGSQGSLAGKDRSMRWGIFWWCVVAISLALGAARSSRGQEEVYHPGETYNSLQAGRDAYWEAEAERRAMIGRQLMLEEQIQAQNTWSDPQDKYRPVRPESYGPVRPRVYIGPTLADVYAYPQSGIVYYNAPAAPPACARRRFRRFCRSRAGVSTLATGARRYLGHALLWLCAAANRACEDLDRAAELHLQAGLRLARNRLRRRSRASFGSAACRFSG